MRGALEDRVTAHTGERVGIVMRSGSLTRCATRRSARRIAFAWPYWQASQVGSSTPQNLMSVAGVELPASVSMARACAATESIADSPPFCEDGTELSCLRSTVLFSAWVAPI